MKVQLEQKCVTIKVPATVANIGSGYDAIGVALDVWNTLTVRCSDETKIILHGEGKELIPLDDSNLIIVGMKAAFAIGERTLNNGMLFELAPRVIYTENYMQTTLPHFIYECHNGIPPGRGMGSSSAAIISGLLAGLILQGIQIPVNENEILFNIACAIEGHPDNVAPALYGGIQIGVKAPTSSAGTPTHARKPHVHWTSSRVPISHKLQCILFVPEMTCQTSEARAILPAFIPREDAIFNLSRTALLVQAFVTGHFDLLKIAMDDQLHQKERSKIMTHIEPLIQAALDAGAYGACLAGAGPSILAFAKGDNGDIFEQKDNQQCNKLIGDAMERVAKQLQLAGKVIIVKATSKGAYVLKHD